MGYLNMTQLLQFGASEFVGTLLLILLGNGVVATCALNGTKGKASGWLTIVFGWFSAIFVSVMVSKALGEFSHDSVPTALLNPVFVINNIIINFNDSTQGLPIVGGIIAILFQVLGAAIGQLLVWVIYKKHYDDTKDASAILGTFSTGPAIRALSWNFLTEVIATFVLVFAISSIGSIQVSTIPGNEITAVNNAQDSLFVGLIVLAIGISLGSATGYSLNPVRDLVPRIMHQILPLKNKGSSDWSYSWVPVAGPIVGGLLALISAPGLLY